MKSEITLVECPRDAIQGIKGFIPTIKKIEYLNLLLESNLFECLDFGSFVSPKAIPQMADTAQVVQKLKKSKTKLLAIIANERGAVEASQFEQITYLGFPFSISETFQLRNTNQSIAESYTLAEKIVNICKLNNKKPVFYLSMAFGNPYGDDWSIEIGMNWLEKLKQLGIKEISLADTTGLSKIDDINLFFESAIREFPDLNIGAHFHSSPELWREKIEAAYAAGCRKFEGAILGFGGCPMADNDLIGNIPTENLLLWAGRSNQLEISNLQNAFKNIL
jgi:hydroxymethylglutaryl-CoA lyase